MRIAEGTLLVLDSRATPFERIWCDFELFKTITSSKPLDIITESHEAPQLLADQVAKLPNESMLAKTLREQNFPIELIEYGLRTQLQRGSASLESDKHRILDSMTNSKVSVELANSRLHGFLARAVWPQAVRHGMVEQFRLPEILVHDTERKRLQVSLAHFGEVGDHDLRLLANGIPPGIVCVRLSFSECHNLTDAGMGHLARRLQELASLTELMLDFVGCTRLSDSGVEALAKALPDRLLKLELHFDMCADISSHAIIVLAAHMGASLKDFSGTFRGTRVDKNFNSKADIAAHYKMHIGERLRKSCYVSLSPAQSNSGGSLCSFALPKGHPNNPSLTCPGP